jgi:hypothetical protein
MTWGPTLVELNGDAFVLDGPQHGTVRLDEHHGDSDLDELDLGGDTDPLAA